LEIGNGEFIDYSGHVAGIKATPLFIRPLEDNTDLHLAMLNSKKHRRLLTLFYK
jgi:hypothetical protein